MYRSTRGASAGVENSFGQSNWQLDVDCFHTEFGCGPGSGPQTSYKRFREPKFQRFGHSRNELPVIR